MHRSKTDRILAGICVGFAEYIGWLTANVRILYMLISVVIATFPGTLLYLTLWIYIPESDEYNFS